ncbi:MAG: lamin tail domain-containing protein, partial [Planctomycetales bacterium]|nr:lamin tail domain-containing protein [Planctomycetales bacterium]
YQLEAVDRHGSVVGVAHVDVTGTGVVAVSQALRVSEMNYHPADPTAAELALLPEITASDFEFVELLNVSRSVVDLAGIRIVNGVEATIADAVLPAGQAALLVRNPAAFALRYGNDLPVVAQFQGQLDNAGETVEIVDANGSLLATITYDDSSPWPTAADGDGATLELTSPLDMLVPDYNSAERWRASVRAGGSPGTAAFRTPDFDGDNQLNVNDVDLLCSGLANSDIDPRWDLDGDGANTQEDLRVMIEVVFGTRWGDANLDGRFDSKDFVQVFQRGLYDSGIESASPWGDGDWNCDGLVNSSDLVIAFQKGGYET